MRVWVAGPDDAADVARLMIAFRNWWERDWPDDEAFARGVERLLADENTEFLLGAVDERASGVCQLRYRYGVWMDAVDCLLEDLYVDESARGNGLGAEIVRAAIGHARERGCGRIVLDVNEANASALALYERLGFSSYVKQMGGHDRFMRLHL
ncbi:MAG TPA: GNAT family N-acetyltransferase [Thermoleophilaceae bacterium]|nr:GNAT family N-acetyltransferase [Thermoleophilaceae bacterium]